MGSSSVSPRYSQAFRDVDVLLLPCYNQERMPSLSQIHRPRQFADVTGQQHVTETLRAEVASGSLGHAFLFSGPRGVGKTTCARILAKALGCAQPQEGEPCGACASCIAFQEGKVFDVIEIDAATHTGVDLIREAIIEHVRFAPAGKRKVYILDEAHMLSTASWNALLKTLEEPPAYAFFIFATTEWHKVPPTIISRCQRFEFRRIREMDMIVRLQGLAKAEGWQIEEVVFPLIASRAEGCLRDAETLLGQIGSLADEGKISLATAGLVIPFSAFDQALSWLEYVRDRRTGEAATAFQAWYDAGISFPTLADDVLRLLKRLLLGLANPADVAHWSNGSEEERRLAALLPAWNAQRLQGMALILIDRRRDLRAGMDPVFILLLAFTAALSVGDGGVPSPSPVVPSAPAIKPVVVEPVPVKAVEPVVPAVTAVPTPVASVSVVPVEAVPAPAVEPVPTPKLAEALAVPAPTPPAVAPAVSVPPSAAPAPANASGLDIIRVRQLWNAFIRAVEEQNHSLPFILKISKPERVEGSVLVIRFPYPFHRDKVIGDSKHLRLVEACAQQVFEAPDLHLDGIVLGPEETAATPEHSSQDVVGNLLKAFGGSVVETG